ncbi:MAG: N-6 DNA methylase [Ignavibacteriae bacterium]|nr:N-6 DNA methylase [Ignavibacteriota bacterium]
MSTTIISEYYNKVEKLIQYGGSKKETSVRNEFYNLLNHYAEKKHLVLVAELPVRGTKGKDVTPDGTLKNVLRLDYGYWESKDEALDLDEEIEKKIKKGYPLTNILFEDSNTAALYQNGEETMRIDMHKPEELDRILNAFVHFEKPEVRRFNEALEKFQEDIPTILETLRTRIEEARKKNKNFVAVSESFLELCKAEINPDITPDDVREMMIQHILTSDIFNKIFDDPEFHKHNNIASELEKLIGILFSYSERKNLLGSIEHYYDAINATAAGIADHHEKQKFLKALYEIFYKAYNPKAADRLGVVYTPNEIVNLMIDSTNHLLEKHFKRVLWDKNVEILDPATGTGTFICNMIDKCPKQSLPYKYKNEIHANEVAILPYYIANLNIEFTFKQKMEYYEEFPNICFVDTLDNIAGLRVKLATGHGLQTSMFQFTAENSKRIQKQNTKKISVVIGNPPYNANQKNENENNKNREYPSIDKRIKDTYIKYSTAQKTKVYDMYARFYRWAMDRIEANGVIAFITNRSFIDSRTFDGFRKCVESDFAHCYIIDTKSDVRANPKIAGTTHNVFGIQTGVAVMFLVKSEKKKDACKIEYMSMPDEWRKQEKWDWFANNRMEDIPFDKITPDKNHNWINIADNDFDELIPCVAKDVKSGRNQKAVFELFSNGIITARDEWSYDFEDISLEKKVGFFCKFYDSEQDRWRQSDKKIPINDFVNRTIKFGSEIESHLVKGDKLKYEKNSIVNCLFRPFTKKRLYFDRIYTHRIYQQENIFGFRNEFDNKVISFLSIASSHELYVCVSNIVFDAGILKQGNGISQCLPLYRYNEKGERMENITDWGLEQFRKHYTELGGSFAPDPHARKGRELNSLPTGKSPLERGFRGVSITKEDIFHYVYAVLHNPAYRKKYELNLKREFPRIPFYKDFWQWAKWGKELMELHINYETATPFALKENTYTVKAETKRQKEIFMKVSEPEPMFDKKPKIKVKLKADKEKGIIEIDELTFLTGVPKEAWDYKLGNRSALEWVLDQYKEKKPSDPTIAEKFNTYRFADYKDHVIDLLKRVCTVSVETMKIVGEIEKAGR